MQLQPVTTPQPQTPPMQMEPPPKSLETWDKHVFMLEASQEAQKDKAAIVQLLARGAKKRFSVITPEVLVSHVITNPESAGEILYHEASAFEYLLKEDGNNDEVSTTPSGAPPPPNSSTPHDVLHSIGDSVPHELLVNMLKFKYESDKINGVLQKKQAL